MTESIVSFCGSLMIPVTTLCIVIFAERQAQILLAKPNLLPERKSLNVKVFLYEYLMQHSLKLGGTNYHFKWVKVPGTTPY
jgi:hypothetical protein